MVKCVVECNNCYKGKLLFFVMEFLVSPDLGLEDCTFVTRAIERLPGETIQSLTEGIDSISASYCPDTKSVLIGAIGYVPPCFLDLSGDIFEFSGVNNGDASFRFSGVDYVVRNVSGVNVVDTSVMREKLESIGV